jgi:hypothetical protein
MVWGFDVVDVMEKAVCAFAAVDIETCYGLDGLGF